MTPDPPAIPGGIGNMTPGGSLGKLDANVLLIHVAPFLGLHASLALAATSTFYRKRILYHALANNTIPAHVYLTSLLPSARAAIKDVHIEPAATAVDVRVIMWGNTLPALRTLKISPGPRRFRQMLAEPNPGLQRISALTIDSSTVKDFVGDIASAGQLRNLLSLTIEHNINHGQCPTPLPAHLLRALGPDSKLTTLSFSSDAPLHCAQYHTAVLALLTALAVPESVPKKLSLLNLRLPISYHSKNDGPSIIVAARMSSLAHPKSAWRLGRLSSAPILPSWINLIWNEGCDSEAFILTQAELDKLIAINEKTWQRSNLTDFFASPVIFVGTNLGDVGLLGTALHGVEFHMSLHKIAPPRFYPSVTYMALRFEPGWSVYVDPKTWLLAAAPNLRYVELITRAKHLHNFYVFPRVHEIFQLPAMPKLEILRLDVKLLLTANARKDCGWKMASHEAPKFRLGWIPSVPTLRLDGWVGCSGCWGDCVEGTLRHYINNGAGGARKVTVRGQFYCFGEEKDDGFGKEWEVIFYEVE
ncbi:hypothetical protein Q9L58_005873 [Maublancomyces gigas]|uniref:F-box domain-containing protein n=1 Tax=Discina gigas TaxID=1032678 RepID=A0ABR3GH06_9PEZI